MTPSKRDLRTPSVMRGPDPNRTYVLEAHPCRFPRTPCSLPGRRVPIRNRNSEGRVTREICRRPKWTAALRLTTTLLPPQGKRNLVVAINYEAQRRQWATSVKRAGMGRRVSQGAEAVGPVSTELQTQKSRGLNSIKASGVLARASPVRRDPAQATVVRPTPPPRSGRASAGRCVPKRPLPPWLGPPSSNFLSPCSVRRHLLEAF